MGLLPPRGLSGPGPREIVHRTALVQQAKEDLREALLGAALSSQGIINVLSHGDIPRRHAYRYSYVVLNLLFGPHCVQGTGPRGPDRRLLGLNPFQTPKVNEISWACGSARMATHPRVLVIGLDSVSPTILSTMFRSHLKRIRSVAERGAVGTLKSCDPPITVPAWAVMFTGMDAGSLGIYGFRNRRPGTYFENVAPTPGSLPYPAVWDTASRMGRRVCVIGVPPGYPPPTVNGVYVSCLLTPPGASDVVFPRVACQRDEGGRRRLPVRRGIPNR